MKTTILCLTLLVVAVSAGTWIVKNPNFATIADAISCASTTTCIAPVGVNGEGSFIWVTRDSGDTWEPEQEPFELMFLGAAMQGNSAVVADELTLLYNNATTAGQYVFGNPAGGDYLVESQNIEAFSGTYYGAAGGEVLSNGNGVGITTDSGKTWAFLNASTLKTESRYGAYPSTSTFFLSAGEWPENVNPAESSDVYQKTSRLHINRKTMSAELFPANGERTAPNDPGWRAQIVKSTDGGKTWVSQFYDEGNFYFNQIGCTDVNHCCAVGEADSSSAPGIRFYCTWDGGKTWTRTLFNPNPSLSVMSLRWIDKNTGWAGGGDMSPFTFTGYFWLTTDGGHTWTNQTVPGMYANEIAFPTATFGLATAFDVMGASALLSFS